MDGYPNSTARGPDLGWYSRVDLQRRRRRRLLVLLPALMLLLGVLAVGCWVVGPSLLPGTPQVISRALVTADGRYIIVPADLRPTCSRAKLSAVESSRQVVLSLSIKEGFDACDQAFGTAAAVLDHPLSGRALIDAATGRPVRYFHGRNLYRVGYLPVGYRPLSTDIPDAFTWRAVNSWTRVYTGPNPEWLEVAQALPSSQILVTYPVTQHAVVNGHQAAIHENTENGQVDERAVTWSADGYAFAVVSEAFGVGFASLPPSELLHVARSVRR